MGMKIQDGFLVTKTVEDSCERIVRVYHIIPTNCIIHYYIFCNIPTYYKMPLP